MIVRSEHNWLMERFGLLGLQNQFANPYILDTNGVIALGTYLFTHPIDIPSLLFTDKKETIISIMKYPLKFDRNPTARNLTINTINTNVECYDFTAGNGEIVLFDLGSTKITRKFNNFADFDGYTQIEVFLPFIGTVSVNPNDFMDNYLSVYLAVDLHSGMGTYYIRVLPDGGIANSRIVATYSVQLGVQIPIGGSKFDETVRNLLISGVKGIASVATSALSPSSSTTTSTKSGLSTKTYDIREARKAKGARLKPTKVGSVTTSTSETRTTTTDLSGRKKVDMVNSVFDSALDALSNAHMTVMGDRLNSTNLMWHTKPFVRVIIKRPKFVEINSDYNFLYGKPLGQIKVLNELHGYTEISNAHLDGVNFGTATSDEIDLIAEELSNGFILP